MFDRLLWGRAGALRTLAPALLGVAAAAPWTTAQQALLTRPAGPGRYDIVAVDEVRLEAAAVHHGLQFLDVGLAGFARSDRLRIDIPTPRTDGPPRIRLPSQGSVYRVDVGDATRLLRAATDGATRVLYEGRHLDGLSALLPTLAASPDGQRLAVATRAEAGGDVVLVDTSGRPGPTVITGNFAPLHVLGDSLRIGPSDVWFLADGRLYHADLRGASPQAHQVALPVTPGDVLLPETAMSADGCVLAVVVEHPDGLRNIVTIDATDRVTEVTTVAQDYDLPAYDDPEGPFLALSADGSVIAWRNTVITKELFSRRVLSADPPQQVTRDANFADTLDNVGILGFIDQQILVFATGESDPDAAFDGADFFALDTSLGDAAEPVNLSQTSGLTAPPYEVQGQLKITRVVADPRGERLLVEIDPNTIGDAGLHLLDPAAPGLQPLLPDVLAPPRVDQAGDHLLIFSTLMDGTTQQLHQLPPRDDPAGLTLLASVQGPGLVFDRVTTHRRGSRAAFVATVAPGVSLPVAVDLDDHTLGIVWPLALELASSLAYTPTGRLLLGLGLAGPGRGFVWAGFAPGAPPVEYPVPASEGFPLQL